MLVILFHAFPNSIRYHNTYYAQGGFIGVDIFFVISGFLISTIIFNNLEADTFSFKDFYSRRIKRLFPALITVLIACYTFGWFVLLPDEFKQLGKHIAGATTYTNNFMFLQESGYFDVAGETKPLLHLWSLSIEEQFYILWPLLLCFCYRRKINLLFCICILAFVSFATHLHILHINKVAAFYQTHLRIWELLIGSIAAYITLHPPPSLPFDNHSQALKNLNLNNIYRDKLKKNKKLLSNLQSIFGIILILLGVIFITKEKYFPGWYAMFSPIAGTVLIITSPKDSWVNKKILSNTILVWFGTISYPLYLWHWPILSYAHILQSETPSWQVRLAAIIISICLAAITFFGIEKPIRFNHEQKNKTLPLIILMIVVGLAGFEVFKNDGIKERLNINSLPGDIGHLEFHKYISNNFYLCTPENIAKNGLHYDIYTRCMQSKEKGTIDIALIGDSHAESLFIGIAESMPNKNVVFYIQGGPPYISNKDFNEIYEFVLNNQDIKKIILSAHWQYEWQRYLPKNSTPENELAKTVQTLIQKQKNILITNALPTYKFDAKKCKVTRIFSSSSMCDMKRSDFKQQNQIYESAINNIKKKYGNIEIIELERYLCDKDFCSMKKNGRLLYRDNNHLNINGSRYIGEKISKDYLK